MGSKETSREVKIITQLERGHPEILEQLKNSISSFIETSQAETGYTPGNKAILNEFEQSLNFQPILIELQSAGFNLSRNLIGSVRASLEDKKAGF